MSPRFVLGWENVPCVAEVVNRSLKADSTDFTELYIKSTETHQYLSSSSRLPKYINKSIRYSLALGFEVYAPPITISSNALINLWSFSASVVTKKKSNHRLTELSIETLSSKKRSRRRGGQAIQIHPASILFEWKSSYCPPRLLDSSSCLRSLVSHVKRDCIVLVDTYNPSLSNFKTVELDYIEHGI